ncbi:MAG: hypothetical protein C4308_07650 [Chitinophagaceae bacterium]
MNTEQLVDIAAGVLTSASLLAQLLKMMKDKEVKDVSPWMLLILFLGLVLWIVYGVMKNDWAIIVTNAFSVLLNAIMLFLRFRYQKTEEFRKFTNKPKRKCYGNYFAVHIVRLLPRKFSTLCKQIMPN